MIRELRDRAALAKPGVSALAAAAAALGCAACAPGGARAVPAGLSVFLLSAGACTLNNFQDRDFDGLPRRTRERPLPAGRLAPRQALLQALLLLAAGLGGLCCSSSSPGGPAAGLLAALLYNAVYTPLKKRTLLALVPGVLCGTLPPLIGWAAAGGDPLSPRAGLLMLLFGVWQLPHLWLLTLAHAAGAAGGAAPSFLDSLPEAGLRRLTLTWTAAFAFLTLSLKMYAGSGPAFVPLAANAVALPLVSAALLYRRGGAAAGFLSGYLNLSMLGATLLAAAGLLL